MWVFSSSHCFLKYIWLWPESSSQCAAVVPKHGALLPVPKGEIKCRVELACASGLAFGLWPEEIRLSFAVSFI